MVNKSDCEQLTTKQSVLLCLWVNSNSGNTIGWFVLNVYVITFVIRWLIAFISHHFLSIANQNFLKVFHVVVPIALSHTAIQGPESMFARYILSI